jgi:L-rhamnose mutarotase
MPPHTSSSASVVATTALVAAGAVAFLLFNREKNKSEPPAPRRFGGAIRLKREQYRRYRELHDDVWKQVLDRMHQSNIRNFTMYYHEETSTMFQCFEWVGHWKYYNENNKTLPSKEQEKVLFDQDMKAIAEDAVTRKWWKECEPCQEPFSQWKAGSKLLSERGSGNWWAPLECVNHCGHWPTAYSKQQGDPDFVGLEATMAAES